MEFQEIVDYLSIKDNVRVSGFNVDKKTNFLIEFPNKSYDGEVFLDDLSINIAINTAPADLQVDVREWVPYFLGKQIAEKYNLRSGEDECYQRLDVDVKTKEDVDRIYDAVCKYNEVANNPELVKFSESLPKIIDDCIKKSL